MLLPRVVHLSPGRRGRGAWTARHVFPPRDPATCTSPHHTSNRYSLSALQRYLYSSTMGNCCGKPSDENFGGEGRTVASTPASAKNNKTTAKVPQGGRTLGSGSEGTSSSSPREAAAKAAEVRTYEFTTKSEKSKPRKPEPKRMVATAWM
jgi:hypothetical protein